VKGAARRLAAHQRVDHAFAEPRHLLAHPAEAAPWPPFTAMNALVMAMMIFEGSNPTTEPLRRITL